MNAEKYGIGLFAVGVLLLFIGQSIANVGNSVDRIIASKWTAVALVIVGGLLFATKTKYLKAL